MSAEDEWLCGEAKDDPDALITDCVDASVIFPVFMSCEEKETMEQMIGKKTLIKNLVGIFSSGLLLVLCLFSGCQCNPVDSQDSDTVTDIDGNVYQTVQIGSQIWMAENLRVTHYRNGVEIPNVTADTSWANLGKGACCYYNNSASLSADYGCLYNWMAVEDSQDIAPEGWHVPSDAEWQILIDYLGGEGVAGGKLKESGVNRWIDPNQGGSDESGFSALPGGFRTPYGGFYGMGYHTSFWSATEYGYRYCEYPDDCHYRYAFSRMLNTVHARVEMYNRHRAYGFSVRCIKD